MATISEYTVLIIADDLTGATDSTTAFARQGFRTRVIADADSWSVDDIAGYEVVAFNTRSRNMTEADSVSAVVSLAHRLAELKPRLILKKIDSTFRGHVLADTQAMLGAFDLDRAVVVPAQPSENRQVTRGVIYVHGAPLKESTFARQQNPPPDNITAAIRERMGNVMIFSGLSTRNLPENPPAGIYFPDINLDEDLVRTARWVIAQGRNILPVCSAGLAHAFARFLKPPVRSTQPAPVEQIRTDGRLLIVIGSTLPEISSQVQVLLSTRPDVAVIEAANGNRIDIDIGSLTEPIIVLRIIQGTKTVSREEASKNLAETTRLILGMLPVSQLVAVGGDTSNAVLNSLGISGFDIAAQDIQGLPRGETVYDNSPLTFVAKPAGFSNTSIFADVAEEFQPRTKGSDL
jgi:D-threonate/D-erythronate kinase